MHQFKLPDGSTHTVETTMDEQAVRDQFVRDETRRFLAQCDALDGRAARRVETAVAPDSWASYLINGDASGIEPDDKAAADAWIERLGWGNPVDCETYGVSSHHDAWAECPFQAQCETYTFLVEKGE